MKTNLPQLYRSRRGMKVLSRWCLFFMLGPATVFCAHAGDITYIYTDPQGTPLAEADAQGSIVATFDYRPFGASVLGVSSPGPGYTGHVEDLDTVLIYMQSRYYDANVGRFLSVDPIPTFSAYGLANGRYVYANENPILNLDPDGMEAKDDQDQGDNRTPPPPPPPPASPPPPPPAVATLDPVTAIASIPGSAPAPSPDLPPISATGPGLSGIPPVIFRLPASRPIFRTPWTKPVLRKIDDILSKQLVKRLSKNALKIGENDLLEASPWTFGVYLMTYSPKLGGCSGSSHCADEAPSSNKTK
jgi:RHS repeat-associated protein